MPYELSAVETRILGCLLEKERHTPENYPLSLHSLTAACNQSTNRDPLVSFDEKTVEQGLNTLREKKLATVIFGAGSRVQKYRHKISEHYTLDLGEISLLTVLLLRGPQTPGELRARTERINSFGSAEAVEACLDGLGKGDSPLVTLLPPRAGQKERRYVQMLSAEATRRDTFAPAGDAGMKETPPSRLQMLEHELTNLREEVRGLREEFAAFRKQFE